MIGRTVSHYKILEELGRGGMNVQVLAQIYEMAGEYEDAIDQLEILLSVPSELSVQSFRLDPLWDPLRDHPRFKQLLDTYSEAGS